MEDVLETHAQPYDAAFPVVCTDERPLQLTKETREPIAATSEHPWRVDYEYEWAGTACIFMFAEPLSGWRKVSARPRRTKVDWALEVEELLRTRYADAEKVMLVCDNFNTHTRGAFYEAFEAKIARELVRRIEFHYTPKHGSWLNIAELEESDHAQGACKNNMPIWINRMNSTLQILEILIILCLIELVQCSRWR
ncbi:MAG TPA: hypothetical protein DIU00_18905 [Phycisphaerales bacterium]|nr:hypothetical protein [Phycisphaerales bacterium]